ncbi:lytic polysaccharide monooxygenase [Polymorphospora rubra]|uniref:lytic polysaccharide monooxygenase n=1 Tax=Polymorphospora rubra TaxID=338584 RepID=UPI0033FCE1C0
MRRLIALPILVVGTVLTSLAIAAPAQAHGYISSPPSRQAQCAQGIVTNCGDIQWEPQSVEGPKGLRSCSGGNARFSVLDNDNKGWRVTNVSGTTTFNWVITARHATSTWEYYIGNTRVAQFNDGGRQPGPTVTHQVNLSGFSGRQKLLAVWNVADTPMAFYVCVDLQIGGGGNPPPTTPPPTNPPPTTGPTPTNPPQTGGTWRAGTAYQVGDQVTFNGVTYRCRQAHTAIAGWEPPYVAALWQQV